MYLFRFFLIMSVTIHIFLFGWKFFEEKKNCQFVIFEKLPSRKQTASCNDEQYDNEETPATRRTVW